MFYFVIDEIAQDLGLINKTIKSLDFGECILQCDGDLVHDYVFDLVHLMFDCPTETAYEVCMNCRVDSNMFQSVYLRLSPGPSFFHTTLHFFKKV